MIVRESIDFQRGQDPRRAMGIGQAAIWRENHADKPFAQITFFLKDPMGNKKRYVATLFYGPDYEGSEDSIWWGRGRLISAWQGSGGISSVGNMQNKPVQFFEGDDEERMMWNNPDEFSKRVINPLLDNRVKEVIDHITEEWWEGNFEDQLREWFSTGVMTVFNVKYEAL
ncbi:MAG TPA: hypothetical protein PK122_02950 [Candidatus Paceibacterota bacterium]|nr:hypothetical protein [Candidatus Paceibacterota bacterium]